jgi:L-asparaginase
MAKKKIILMSTGGTIVSSGDSATQTTGYRLGNLSISALLDQLADLKDKVELEQEAISHVDSSSMTSDIWLKLARRVQAAVDRSDVDGVVITHGTDTMEETAYFLHLILKTEKPVVITGAMRPATALSADGTLNLYNAFQVALEDKSQGMGVLMVLNNTIGSARFSTKTNTTNVATFSGLNTGELGAVIDNAVMYYNRTTRPHTMTTPFSIQDFKEDESFPRVDILISHADDDDKLVDASVAIGAKGIVFAGLGNGCIPDKVLPGLVRASKTGVRVIRSSRVFSGPVFNGLTEWEEAGLISAWNLSAVKSRILLQLALKKGITDIDALREMFERY